MSKRDGTAADKNMCGAFATLMLLVGVYYTAVLENWWNLLRLNVHKRYNHKVPLFSMYATERHTYIQEKICTRAYTATLSVLAKT